MKKYKTVIFIACLFSMASLAAQDSFFDGSDMISGENDDSTKTTSYGKICCRLYNAGSCCRPGI
ncbi:MAG: hypothetical protein P1P63_03010 [Treponemataceae bacterium]